MGTLATANFNLGIKLFDENPRIGLGHLKSAYEILVKEGLQ